MKKNYKAIFLDMDFECSAGSEEDAQRIFIEQMIEHLRSMPDPFIIVSSKITTTPKELMENDVWEEACELLGLKIYCVNEGLMDYEEVIELEDDQAKILELNSAGQETNT